MDLSKLPPPPKGQTGVTLQSLQGLPPPPTGQQGMTLDQVKQSSKPTSSAFFPSSPTDNFLVAGAKAVGNLPKSGFNLAESIWTSLSHPIQTSTGILKTIAGGTERGLDYAFNKNTQDENTQTFDAVASSLKSRYGSFENLQKTATEDPIGFGADVLSVLEGGASLLGKGELVSNAVGKVGSTVTSPIAKTATAISDTAKGATKFGVSQATGLNPETISQILKNPEQFKNINPELRVETAQKVGEALDSRLHDLSDMGKGYNDIRSGTSPVTIPDNTVKNVLDKYGVKLDGEGKIITSPESRPLSPGDKTALQDFLDNYGGVTSHTPNSFLNTREALSNLAKYDSAKTGISTTISRDLRSEFDKLGKAQIPGLNSLDTAYAPERELLGQLKKDIFDAKGELKDTAISKIANLTGKGKEQVLERVKQIIPDVEQRVNLIKAVEDIQRASGLKVGTYVRSAALGGGLLTGNIPAIIGAIIAQPEIAVPLLKGAGYVGQKAAPVLEAIHTIASDVNNFRLPKPILDYAENPKMGASIKAVTETPEKIAKNIGEGDLRMIREYLNGDLNSHIKAEPMLQAMGIAHAPTDIIKRFLNEVLDLSTKKLPVKSLEKTSNYLKGTKGLFTGSKAR